MALSSIFDMFSTKGGAAGGQAAPLNNGQPTGQQATGTNGNPTGQAAANQNPTVPNENNSPVKIDAATGEEQKSPLDKYNEIWQPSETKKEVPLFNVDTTKMMEAAGSIDFTKVATPELLARVKAGGDDAIAAQMEISNKMSQAVFAQSAITTTKLVEQAVEKTRQQFVESLPDIIKGQNASDLLRTENPVFDNPAISPVLKALENQIRTKNPQFTASQVASMAKEWFLDVSGTVQNELNPPKDTDASGKTKRKQTDWSTYLD